MLKYHCYHLLLLLLLLLLVVVVVENYCARFSRSRYFCKLLSRTLQGYYSGMARGGQYDRFYKLFGKQLR